MGQSLAAVKDEATKQSIENEKLANDSLNSLISLAEAQGQLFYDRVSLAQDQKLIPIDTIVRKARYLQASVSSDSSELQKSISDIISSFASGSFVTGITKVICLGIAQLFGEYNGNSSKIENYLITLGPLGGIYRIDYFMYSYRFSSEQLIKVTKNVVLVQVVVSSVVIDKIDSNTLKTLIQLVYGDLPKNLMLEMYQEAWEDIVKSRHQNMKLQSSEMTKVKCHNQLLSSTNVDDGHSTPIYTLISKKSGKAIDVSKGLIQQGASLIQSEPDGGKGQQWVFELLREGVYKISSRLTGLVLDVNGASKEPRARIIQWKWNGGDNQQWTVEKKPDGFYVIKSLRSGLVIDVPDGSLKDGAQLQQWNELDVDNQKWKFIKEI